MSTSTSGRTRGSSTSNLIDWDNERGVFADCQFQNVRFNVSRHTDAAFINCTFTHCSFFDATFTRCKLVGSKLDRCTLTLLKVYGGRLVVLRAVRRRPELGRDQGRPHA